MGTLWFLLGILAVVVLVVSFALWRYMKRESARAARNQRFKEAIIAEQNKRDRAILIEKSHPDAYIAEREILKIKQRYLDGEEFPS